MYPAYLYSTMSPLHLNPHLSQEQTHESTPGVVSHTPARPGCLYLMVTFVGDMIVVTPVASAGSCLGLNLINAAALQAESSAAAAVLRSASPNMTGGD